MNYNFFPVGKANASVLSRLDMELMGPVLRLRLDQFAQVERDFKLGLARLNICKQARQDHRQRQGGMGCFFEPVKCLGRPTCGCLDR